MCDMCDADYTRTCSCGKSGRMGKDPFLWEIYGEIRESVMCDDCRERLAEDI